MESVSAHNSLPHSGSTQKPVTVEAIREALAQCRRVKAAHADAMRDEGVVSATGHHHPTSSRRGRNSVAELLVAAGATLGLSAHFDESAATAVAAAAGAAMAVSPAARARQSVAAGMPFAPPLSPQAAPSAGGGPPDAAPLLRRAASSELPLSPTAAAAAAAFSPYESSPGPVEGLRVLVAEDLESHQRVARMVLRKAGVASPLVVSDGEQAVHAACSEQFDVIFMDCEMPVCSGVEAAARIRAFEDVRGLRPCFIAALTVHCEDEDKAECLKAGCDFFCAKPATVEAVREVLERALHARAARAAAGAAPAVAGAWAAAPAHL